MIRSLWAVAHIRATAHLIRWFVPDNLTVRVLRRWLNEDR